MLAHFLLLVGLAAAVPAAKAPAPQPISPAAFRGLVAGQLSAFVTAPSPTAGLAELERLANLPVAEAPALSPDRAAARAVLSLLALPELRRLDEAPAVRRRLAEKLGAENISLLENVAAGFDAVADAAVRRSLLALRERVLGQAGAGLQSVELELKSFFDGWVAEAGAQAPGSLPVAASPASIAPGAWRGLEPSFRARRRLALEELDPAAAPEFAGLDEKEAKKRARALTKANMAKAAELQAALYAEGKHGLLVVLQGMDTSGKDGVVRRVFGALNPAGVAVHGLKVPTPEEARHDYLWRVHPRVPARGMIAVLNRSHYEDLVVPVLKGSMPAGQLRRRVRQVRDFERYLVENGVAVLKLFLHISKAEQKRRLERRLADPTKHWKLSVDDLKSRELWPRFLEAYGEALARTSAPWAPWFVVPADKKWYRDWLVSEILLRALESLAPKFPELAPELRGAKIPD